MSGDLWEESEQGGRRKGKEVGERDQTTEPFPQ